MRSINELLSQFERVWFLIDDDYKDCFISECNENGYTFNTGEQLTKANYSSRFALHASDKTIWYISGMVWNTYFSNPGAFIFSPDNCIRLPVDYRAFVRGNREYIYNLDRELVAPENYNYTPLQSGIGYVPGAYGPYTVPSGLCI